MTYEFDDILDTQGLFCPEPVMLLHKKMRDVQSGQVLKVIATDPATCRDVPKFCHFLGHDLVRESVTDTEFVYFIRKKP